MVTLLLVSAVLTLALLVVLPYRILHEPLSKETPLRCFALRMLRTKRALRVAMHRALHLEAAGCEAFVQD